MSDKEQSTADKIRAHMEKIRKSLGAIDTHLEDGKRSLDSIGKPNSLKEETFGSAFKAARASGKETFSYGGKSYTTQKAGESSGQWKNNLKPSTDAPVPLPRPRPKFDTKVVGKPDAPVGSLPAKKPVEPTVRTRPDAPVGSLPKSKFEPVVKTRPDAPVGSLPAKKPVPNLRLPSDPRNDYVKSPPSSYSSSAKSAADTLASRMRRDAAIKKVDVVGNMGKPPVVSNDLKTALANKAASVGRVKVGIKEQLSNLIDRYRNKRPEEE